MLLLTTNFDGKPRSNTSKIMSKNKNSFFSFFLHCNIIIININTRKIFYNAHIKPHIDYVTAMWDGCSENNFQKTFNSLHQRAGKLILPDPSLSTEANSSGFRILNLLQKFTYNKELFIYKALKNNSPNNLAQLFFSHRSPFSFSFLSFCLMSSDAKEHIRDNL